MCGTAFAMQFNILHTFCARPNCTDGDDLYGGLTKDAAGNLYGTTFQGGTHNLGTIYKLSKSADGRRWIHELLYSFCRKQGCTDGRSPTAPPVVDTSGNLFGSTSWGGLEDDEPVHLGHGILYELSPPTVGKRWTFRVLHTFCADGTCADGEKPETLLTYAGAAAGQLFDGSSPLYGVTKTGGAQGSGAAFSLESIAGTRRWREHVIYSFCSSISDGICRDGAVPGPEAGLTMDALGNLDGTTLVGGSAGTGYQGVVFRLSQRGKNRWRETIIYNFCSQYDCADGAMPYSGVVQDARGNLYGTTFGGGKTGSGVVYRLSQKHHSWSLDVLRSFCVDGINSCWDGGSPWANIALDDAGNVFGTTYYGGDCCWDLDGEGGGVLFEIGSGYQLLHDFCSAGEAACLDGEYPHSALISDGRGGFYGTAELGGKNGGGAIFEITP
jgi:uncharacterized repeat protein (TIGR03803 family)